MRMDPKANADCMAEYGAKEGGVTLLQDFMETPSNYNKKNPTFNAIKKWHHEQEYPKFEHYTGTLY